jgi:Raf kinase inhibitor-like YbhB/YbcL family protein
MVVLALVALTLASGAFSDGGTLPSSAEYNASGCTGSNTPPDLHWKGAPDGTQSFALTIHDPDAQAPGGWWHWVVFDIPSSTSSLGPMMRNAMTASSFVEGTTSFGSRGYGGPCPPPGKPHHYVFTLYALDSKMNAMGSTTGPQLLKLIEGHVLAKATLTGLYGR